MPRGNGKTWLAAHLLTRALTPGDPLHVPGAEVLLCAASIEQARLCFRFIRADLEPTGDYRFIDSVTRIGIVSKRDNTRLRVLSSNGKTSAWELLGCPRCWWQTNRAVGRWSAGSLWLMQSTRRKVNPGRQCALFTSVRWHRRCPVGGMIWSRAGATASTYVQALQGRSRPSGMRLEGNLQAANPLTKISAEFRKKLREELAAAQSDTRLKARFMSYRLNVPSGDESQVLLTVDDWERVTDRPVAERVGKAIVGCDLGGGRAFSAAVAVWKSGRVEAIAVCPGIPDVAAQERRDRVPQGTYQELVDSGTLRVAHGWMVQPPVQLVDAIVERWGTPATIVCDRFREKDLRDASRGIPIESRVTQWSEASFDIRALRRFCKDGPFSVELVSRGLLAAGLAVSTVKNDDAGNSRLVKSKQNTARDDAPAAWLLAAGAFDRALSKPKRGAMFRGAA